jgi:hypothetical protein
MKEVLVSRKIAELLHKIEFDEFTRYFIDSLGKTSLFPEHSYYNKLNKNSKIHLIEQYENILSCPTLSLTQKFIRENHNLHPYIVPDFNGEVVNWRLSNIGFINRLTENFRLFYDIQEKYKYVKFETYEEALDVAIFECLEFLTWSPSN